MKRIGSGTGMSVQVTVNGATFDAFAGQSVFQVSGGTGLGAGLTGVHNGYTFAMPAPSAPREIARTFSLSDLAGAWGPLNLEQAAAIRAVAATAGEALGTSRDASVAFQMALWEISSDFVAGQASSLNVTSGSFRARGLQGTELAAGVTMWLNAMFDAVGQPVSGAEGLLGAASPEGAAPPVIVQIPLPPAAWAGLAGLAAIVIARRRKLI